MAPRLSNPFEAREIAEHGVYVLREIRSAPTIDRLNELFSGWLAYATQKHVCPQIREHLSGAYAEVSRDLKAKRVVRDPTGEAAWKDFTK